MKRFTARACALCGAFCWPSCWPSHCLARCYPVRRWRRRRWKRRRQQCNKPVEWGGGGNCSTWYTVRFGDTLSGIAVRFGTTVKP